MVVLLIRKVPDLICERDRLLEILKCEFLNQALLALLASHIPSWQLGMIFGHIPGGNNRGLFGHLDAMHQILSHPSHILLSIIESCSLKIPE